jgi:hypothetical protein
MFMRIAILLSAAFWLTMNYLLWRSEFGGPNQRGTLVPAEVVWRKILTSPDDSSLDILHHGRKMGYARWAVSERRDGVAGGDVAGGPPASGPVGKPYGYRLGLEGSVQSDAAADRIHFDVNVQLAADRTWQEMDLRVTQHENVLAIRTRAAEGIVHLTTESDGEKLERVLTFAELRNPRALAEAFAVPVPLGMIGIPDLPTDVPGGVMPERGLAWEARSDRINLSHTAARAYRLQARLMDRWQIVMVVSPVGEILRVELPDDWLLVSDETGGL